MKILICVDVQNDFIDGVLGVDKDRKITDGIVKYAEDFHSEGGIVYATKDTHFDNYLDTLEGKNLPIKHCIESTNGWNIPDRLAEVSDIWEKTTFGSLSLMDYIGGKKFGEIEEIELCGFCTSICVISNAILLRAKLPDTKISIIENLCGDINNESHQAALKVAKNCQIEIKSLVASEISV